MARNDIEGAQDGRTPIVLAYGLRWDRKLWEKKQKKKLPKFINFPTRGIYIYYWKGKPVYIGIEKREGKGKLHTRIAEWHKPVGDDWDSFSWFVVNRRICLRDIERFCLTTLTHLGAGQSRRVKDYSAPFHKNEDPSGFLLERHSYRNYSLDKNGNLTTPRIDGMFMLTREWQGKCRPARQLDVKLWEQVPDLDRDAGGRAGSTSQDIDWPSMAHDETSSRRMGAERAMLGAKRKSMQALKTDSDPRKVAERAVLGTMLVSPKALAKGIRSRKEEQFVVGAHRVIFHAIRALCAAGQVVDGVTVVEFLRKMGQLQSVGGGNAISILINHAALKKNDRDGAEQFDWGVHGVSL